MRSVSHQGKRKAGGGSHSCPCEARRAAALGAEGDEAISIRGMGDCFASLAMTYRAVPSNDSALALRETTLKSALEGIAQNMQGWCYLRYTMA